MYPTHKKEELTPEHSNAPDIMCGVFCVCILQSFKLHAQGLRRLKQRLRNSLRV